MPDEVRVPIQKTDYRVVVYLPEEIAVELGKEAYRLERPLSWVVRQIIIASREQKEEAKA
jgi:hypothetical protein